jgi:hypothetical protein
MLAVPFVATLILGQVIWILRRHGLGMASPMSLLVEWNGDNIFLVLNTDL